MSEQESNICEKCGGVKRVEYTISFEEGVPRDMRINAPEPLPETGWRLCPGHPGPAQKHDGNLDQRAQRPDLRASVSFQDNFWLDKNGQVVEISGGYGDCENCRVLIDPAQSLSLLAWLRQEEAELERMAKEQERG